MDKIVWTLMYNVERNVDSGQVTGIGTTILDTITTSKPIRVYQQRALALAKMEQANKEAGEYDTDGNYHYYSIEEVNYV